MRATFDKSHRLVFMPCFALHSVHPLQGWHSLLFITAEDVLKGEQKKQITMQIMAQDQGFIFLSFSHNLKFSNQLK